MPVKQMIQSKKFIAALTSVVVAAGAKYGLELAATDVAVLIAPLLAYIGGQGLADLGKERRQ